MVGAGTTTRSRRARRSLRAASVAILAVGAASGLALISSTGAGATTPTSVTFSYTGVEQSFTVPPGVSSISVVATGGGGGSGYSTPAGGAGGAAALGAQVTATLSVAPGETLYVEVGGTGAPGSLFGAASGFNPTFRRSGEPFSVNIAVTASRSRRRAAAL